MGSSGAGRDKLHGGEGAILGGFHHRPDVGSLHVCGADILSGRHRIGSQEGHGVNTRQFLVAIAIFIVSLSLPGVLPAQAGDSQPPNILFILVDDLGKEWIGCYGAQDIQAPHIDALTVGGQSMGPGAGLTGLSVDFA